MDAYIAGFPANSQEILSLLRQTIKRAAPESIEIMSYNMPAFKQKGIIAYFAGYKNHVGFYPTAIGIDAFKSELDSYTWSKGTIQFPLDKPLPVDLITKIILYKVNANLLKSKK